MAAVLLASVRLGSGAEALADFSLAKLRIEKTKVGFELRHTDRTFPPTELFLDGGTPRLLSCEVAKSDRRIGLVTYYSGSAGTSQFYKVTRVVVVDLDQKKILGVVLHSYTPQTDEPLLRQPEWIWGAGRLTVRDQEYGGEIVLRW